MPVMRRGGSSRVLSGNLPLFATFSIFICTPPQRWRGRDGRADEAAAVLMRRCLHADREVWGCEASWQHADASGGGWEEMHHSPSRDGQIQKKLNI